MPEKQYFIIGDGVLGLSTAFHLDSRNITILSHRQSQEPSNDISKIIRIDYPNERRMKEAVVATEAWKNNKLFNEFHRPVGRVVAYSKDNAETLGRIDATRGKLGMRGRERLDHQKFEGFFGPMNSPPDLTFVWNNDDGLVEWMGCMKAVRDLVKERDRSRMLELKALRLLHEEEHIRTVVLSNGEKIEVTDAEVIVAAGPWISELLQKSDIPQPERSLVATGLFAFYLQLNEEQSRHFKNKPVFSHIGYAEFLPPTKDDGIAKITRICPFTNIRSGSLISCPKDLSDSHLATAMMLDMKHWVRTFLPKLIGARITRIVSYWDAMTQSQTPLIARHPQYHNLSIVGGGSYNRAKDLPVLGKKVVDMLADRPLDSSYGWNASAEPVDKDQPLLLAEANFEGLEHEAAKNPKVQAWRAQPRDDGYLDVI